VGNSLRWKINEEINTNEYLGIVLTPEALNSEWVKTEIDAGWVKQINSKRIVVIPILLRDCEIPLLLAGRKYADFRTVYDNGFSELASIFGIKNTDTISESNWRKFTKCKGGEWKKFREMEFSDLVTALAMRAREFNWSLWTGSGNNRYSISVSARWSSGANGVFKHLSVRLCGKTNAYMLCPDGEYNPNNLNASDFTIHIGNTINACEEYIWRKMKELNLSNGHPEGQSYINTHKFIKETDRNILIKEFIRKTQWDKNMPL
jgi:hypothetical protein